MARRKNRPELVRVKCCLAERLREIRAELYGERGGSEMARRLGVPVRTWYNYEAGVTVPAEVLLRFMELTHVEPSWLLHGEGPRYRAAGPEPITPPDATAPAQATSVEALLRTALERLEQQAGDRAHSAHNVTARRNGLATSAPAPPRDERADEAMQSWLSAQHDGRVVRVEDDAMAPILLKGAHVAYASETEAPDLLDGSLVVAWVDGIPLVRWFRRSGNYAMLSAENPEATPTTRLVELAGASKARLRRVLWISTTHG
jgi:transcriptional regulator with XRE-family HTH domain